MGLELTRPVQARRESGVGSSSRIQYTPSAISTRTSSGIDPVWTSRDRPHLEDRRVTVPNWDSGKMERVRRSIADWRLRGASPRSASPHLALAHNRGRQSAKGCPSFGGVVDPSHSGNLRPRLIGYSGSIRDANAPVTRIRLRSSIRRGCWDWLRLWRGNPRTRSHLPRLRRL
jgi:hypothetical protein